MSLEPASEWVKSVITRPQSQNSTDWRCLRKYFPGGRCATILLGPREELRDTIPQRVLYENSSYFSDHYDSVEAEEKVDDAVRLPEVDPLMFDLVIQCLVTNTFTLDTDPMRLKATEITILLELIFLNDKLGLPDIGQAVVEKLRNILIDDRRALRRKHIKMAFQLEEDHSVQELFSQAVVREYMKTSSTKQNGHEMDAGDDSSDDDDDDDDELKHRDGAHRALHMKNRFSFQRELDNIRGFKFQLLLAQDKVIKSGKKVMVHQATKLRPAVHAIKYADPLNEAPFYL